MAHGLDVRTIGAHFNISDGSVTNFTDRSLQAIIRQQHRFLSWPTVEAREYIKEKIQREHGIPDCVGYIDGTHIILEYAPAKPKQTQAGFFSRKGSYGMLLLATIDHNKRFTFLHYGYSSRSSDIRAQYNSSLYRTPGAFFSDGEYVLGDSGFLCTLSQW
nr:uncharacterized protein I203_08555 [Kwoniella mangroviensis CBS 8507]OCF62370.1 hypothetical protein I203_08555 [Kwoniella mangroviensis CBS 8507]